ncbi:MAG: hypothetical protein ACQERB_15095 [Promethearchaeati archaeon]
MPIFTSLIQGETSFITKIEDFERGNLKNSHIYYRETEGGGYDVYVNGDYAYIADDWKGLAIIDISDPTNPGAPIYEDIPSGWAQAVYISGNYAYVAYTGMTKNGLAIIDVSDPEHPVLVANVDTECAWDVYVSGNYAYVADDNNGLAIIDISDPTIPVSIANITTYDVANGVFISGNYAYVADGNAGLTVIDVSDPTNPGIAANEDTDGYAQAVYVSGNDAFIADGSAGLVYINVQSPTNPGTPYYENTYGAVDVVISGDYAYTVDLYGMVVFDIHSPPFPNDIAYEDIDGYTRGICIEGNYAYISGSVGLAVVDISKNIDPLLINNEITMGEAIQVCIDGNYAFIADYDQGLTVVNIFDPTHPAIVANINTTDYAWDVDVDGNYAYVASSYSGLAIIDIKYPDTPGAPVYLDTDGCARAVDISGDYAYVADGLEGLKVIDISDPTIPVLAGQKDTAGYATDVKIDGDYAYMTVGADGLAIIDIKNPNSPGAPIYIDPVYYAHGVDIRGDFAYIAEHSNVQGGVLNVIDISNPLSPLLASRIGTLTSSAYKVYVSGNYAYIASEDRLTVIDLKWDGTGSHYTHSDTINECIGVYVEGDYAYVASRSEGLVVVQIRERADLDDPIITENPSDLLLECGYTGKIIAWRATDLNPDTYTIELQGSGNVAGPTAWSSGVVVTYDIPNGLGVGTYTYTINFTDTNGNFATDTVEVTVQDTENPVIIDSPDDKIVGLGYSGVNFQWTATDENPYNYTIELQGSGNVVDSTGWSSGIPIVYNVPEGLGLGEYYYTINFTDDYGHFIPDTAKLSVQDIKDPVITDAPTDIAVELGYPGTVNLQWNATDDNPNTYTIELQGSGSVAGPTAWSSGVAVNYDIPNGLPLGEYYYIINYTDDYQNFVIDTVKFTVGDTVDPIITDAPADYECFIGYADVCLFWIATDAHPATFTVEHQGHGIVAGPNPWISGNNMSYTLPEGLSVGEHFFTINFTDLAGNFATDTVKITIQEENGVDPPSSIPFGNWFLVFMTISIIGIVFIQNKRKK